MYGALLGAVLSGAAPADAAAIVLHDPPCAVLVARHGDDPAGHTHVATPERPVAVRAASSVLVIRPRAPAA